MKAFFFAMIFFISQNIFASDIVYVNGNSTEDTYCRADTGYYCLQDLKRRAESEALRDARWECEVTKNGRALLYSASYYSFCSPSYLPPRNEATWVTCRSSVRLQCQL